jgi:hypothetical protein
MSPELLRPLLESDIHGFLKMKSRKSATLEAQATLQLFLTATMRSSQQGFLTRTGRYV